MPYTNRALLIFKFVGLFLRVWQGHISFLLSLFLGHGEGSIYFSVLLFVIPILSLSSKEGALDIF